MTSPFSNAAAYDRIALDGEEVALLCRRLDGGEREWEFQDAQQPGFAGAFTVLRKQNLTSIGYQFVLLSEIDRQTDAALVERLMAGGEKRPPREYELTDARLEGLKIRRVATLKIGPLEQKSPGGVWMRKIAFKEIGKRVPIGGPVQPPQSPIEAKIQELNAENKALAAQLDAAQKASKAGK